MASRDRKRFTIAVALASALLAGCGDDNGGGGPGTTPTPTATSTPGPCPHVITYTFDGELSDLDFGWTGVFANQTSETGASLSFGLTCEGDTLGHCGSCQLRGPVQSTTAVDNHRCIHAPEIRCVDDAGCPESIGTPPCGFFFGPPLPIGGAGMPVCVVSRIPSGVTGVVNPDAGSFSSDIAVEFATYTATDLEEPCPICSGAARGDTGTCHGGPRNGQSCTVDATTALFGNTSFDCPPDPTARVGASTARLNLTTGTSSLAPIVNCTGATFAGAHCYCPGQALPNACGSDPCIVDDVNDHQGVCIIGPNDDQRCHTEEFRPCVSDEGCPRPGDFCTFLQRECLGGADPAQGVTRPILRVGAASPTNPLLAGTFCLDATTSATVNEAVGLPGPGAVLMPVITCIEDHCP